MVMDKANMFGLIIFFVNLAQRIAILFVQAFDAKSFDRARSFCSQFFMPVT